MTRRGLWHKLVSITSKPPNPQAGLPATVDVVPAPGPRGNLEYHKWYDNIDGTGEMFMGLMVLGFALLGYLQTILPEHSIWRTNSFCGLLFLYAVLILVLGPAYWLRRVIKRRITFPRTGYVVGHSVWRAMFAPRPANGEPASGLPTRRGMWGAMLGLALLSAVVAAGLVCVLAYERRHVRATMWLADVGYVGYLGFWVLIYAFWIWRIGREHAWKWLLLVLMTLGLLVIGLVGPGNFIEVARLVMLFVGAVWVISGMGTLCSYLRRTRPHAPETK